MPSHTPTSHTPTNPTRPLALFSRFFNVNIHHIDNPHRFLGKFGFLTIGNLAITFTALVEIKRMEYYGGLYLIGIHNQILSAVKRPYLGR